MVNPNLALDEIQNIARLRNLGRIGGRRRVASTNPPYIEEEALPDLGGTADTSQGIPPFAEEAVQPKSYDVRSNNIIPEPQPMPEAGMEPIVPQQEEPGFWNRLGTALKSNFTPAVSEEAKKAFPYLEKNAPQPTQTPIPQSQIGNSGMLEPGNIDLTNRPVVHNPDGSISTVASRSYDFDGKEVLLPTISDDGRVLNDQEAQDQFLKTGKHLGIFSSPEAATAYAQQLHEDQQKLYVPQETEKQEQQPEEGFWGRLGTALKANFAPPVSEEAKKTFPGLEQTFPYLEKNAPRQPQGAEAVQTKQALPGMPEAQETSKEPLTYAEPGSIEQVSSDPTLSQALDKLLGVEITPEMMQNAKDMESAIKGFTDSLTGYETRLTEHQTELKNQIASRNLSGNDKILMAIALLAPAIIGGAIGGPEAFLGGVAGGAQSLTGVLKGREEEKQGMQDKLSQLAMETTKAEKERIGAEKERAEFEQKIKASTHNHDLRELFNNEGKLLNGEVVLDTGNPLLPLKFSAVKSVKDAERFKNKEMLPLQNDLAQTIGAVQSLDRLKKVLDYGRALQKSGGILGQWAKDTIFEIPGKALKAYVPYTRDTFIDPNTGETITIANLYETIRRQLAAKYAKTELGKGQFTGKSEQHAREILPNPFSKEVFKEGKTDLGTNLKQMETIYDTLTDTMINKASMAGVDIRPMQELFQTSELHTSRKEQKRQKDRAEMAAQQVIKGK
jgi:hypothetical protein